jgi:hypothetical protein
MVSCCLLGSRILLGKGVGLPEGDLAWRGWVRDALPLKGSWLPSAVVDPGNDLCYLNFCCWMKQQQKGLSSGALVVEHSIPLPKEHSLAYKCVWGLSG